MSRVLIAQAAENSDELGYGRTSVENERYARWLYPFDTLEHALEMAKDQWTCGLESLSVLRDAGIDAPELGRPYWGSNKAVTWLLSIADRSGARVNMDVPSGEFYPPERGDILYIGEKIGYGGAGHVRCIIERNGLDYISADGGQIGGGTAPKEFTRCIKERTWRLEQKGNGNWWCEDTDGIHSPQQPGVGRRCVWYVNGDMLPRIPISTPS